jgi:hypothetical protein
MNAEPRGKQRQELPLLGVRQAFDAVDDIVHAELIKARGQMRVDGPEHSLFLGADTPLFHNSR